MKKVFVFLFCVSSFMLWSQDAIRVKGSVENENTRLPMETVHVLNLTQVIGTTTDREGGFEIPAALNDTLYFSYLGYKPLKVAVTSDMLKFKNTQFRLTELAYALEEVVIRPYQLTGYLDVDARNIPLNNNSRYQISGLPNVGYEAGNRDRSAFSKALGALFNPADFLHNLFGKNPKQMRKLKKMREDDEIKNLLLTKFDRTVLEQLLGLERVDIDEILRNCSYSDVFIRESNDLQILEAISGCYEEYRVLRL